MWAPVVISPEKKLRKIERKLRHTRDPTMILINMLDQSSYDIDTVDRIWDIFLLSAITISFGLDQ